MTNSFKSFMASSTFAVLAFILATAQAHAETQIGGYFTQAWVKTDKNNYFGPSASSGGSLKFNEAGIQANTDLTDHIMAAGSVVVRNAGGTDTGDVRVDYAHLVVDSSIGDWGVRAMIGRNKLDYTLFNSTRDVASTRPSILLPQSSYFDNARAYMINGDGAEVGFTRNLSDSTLTMKLYAETPIGADNVETKRWFMGVTVPGKIKEDLSYAYMVDWSNADTELRAYNGFGTIRYTPGASDYLSAGHIDMNVLFLSAVKRYDTYTFMTEWYGAEAKYRDFGPYVPDFHNSSRGVYFQFGKKITPNSEAFIRRDVLVLNMSDKNGQVLASKTGRPASDGYGYDTTIGGRYRVADNQYLSAEIHHIHGTAWLPYNDQPIDRQADWNMFLMQYTINW